MELQQSKQYLRQNQIRFSCRLKQKSTQDCGCVREMLDVGHKYTRNVATNAVYIPIQTMRLAHV
jgi:hypothetical protein